MLPSFPPMFSSPVGLNQFAQPRGIPPNGYQVVPGALPPPVQQWQGFGCPEVPQVWQQQQGWFAPVLAPIVSGPPRPNPPFLPHGGPQQSFPKRQRTHHSRQEKKKPKFNDEDNMEGAYKCENCSRSYSEKTHFDNHVRSHKKCQHPGCDFEAIHKVLNDHILVHTIPKELFFDSPEDIAKWREERRRNYPTREAIQRKLTEREEKLKRGEVLPTRVSKYKGHGFHNNNSESNFRFGRGRGRGRGRGSFSRGRGRGFHRGRGGARHFNHHSHFTSHHHHQGDDDDNSVDVSEDELESVVEATVLLSQTTSSFPVDGISSSGRPPSSDSTLELSGPPSTTPASELSGREACALDSNGSDGGRDSSLKHSLLTSTETTTSLRTSTNEDVPISVKSSTKSASSQSTCTHVTTTEDGIVVESTSPTSTVSPTQTSVRTNDVCIVVSDDMEVSQQGLPLQDTPHLDTPQHPKDTPIQEAALQKAALNDASLLDSSVSARLAHGHSEVGSHLTGSDRPSQVQHNNFKRKKLTLLQKLLAPEIRSERNKILQCVRFIVQNNFFDECNPQN